MKPHVVSGEDNWTDSIVSPHPIEVRDVGRIQARSASVARLQVRALSRSGGRGESLRSTDQDRKSGRQIEAFKDFQALRNSQRVREAVGELSFVVEYLGRAVHLRTFPLLSVKIKLTCEGGV